MDEAIAMQIVGAVSLLIGMKMNINPKGFNEDIFGKEAHESALGEMNAMRMAVGGGVLAVSAINLICSFTMDYSDSMAALLTASAVGLSIFLATIDFLLFKTLFIPLLKLFKSFTLIALIPIAVNILDISGKYKFDSGPVAIYLLLK